MDSEKQKRMIRESERITKRMENSRREIARLKADYERLIEQGKRGTSLNVTDTDKQKEIQNKREDAVEASKEERQTVRKGIFPGISPQMSKSPDTGTIPKVTKVKNYNVEEAREFMRKQKEKRLQQMKETKEANNVVEVKKQKLQELHKKSLQIVARNRERSKSRERLKAMELERQKSPNSGEILTSQCKIEKNCIENKSNFNNSSAKSDDAKIKAATMIQACFRGHKQRKLFKILNAQRKTLEFEKKLKEERKIEEEIERRLKEEREFQKAAAEATQNFPEWLQEGSGDNPYNFINTVRRKLNLALPLQTVDVAVQNSISEQLFTPRKSTKEVREMITQNLSSKKSEKKFSEIVEHSLKSMTFLQVPENDQHSIITAPVDVLDNKPLNNYRLKTSDSDTSNNIPDISLESQFDSYRSSSSSVQVKARGKSPQLDFRKPNQPPKKPKRLLKSQKSKIELEDRPTNETKNDRIADDFLNMNTERLKMMKLDPYKIHSSNSKLKKSKHANYKRESEVTPKQTINEWVESGNQADLRRTSFIAGNICRYSQNTNHEAEQSPSTPKRTEATKDAIGNMDSFQRYVNDANETPKITYTPFQTQKRERRVVNLDADLDLLSEQIRQLDYSSKTNQEHKEPENDDKGKEDQVVVSDSLLHAPKVKLNIEKSKCNFNFVVEGQEDAKISESNQILVKFQADLHFLNDFNHSLRQIERIDKSMLELQTKCIQTQTTNPETDDNIIEKSVNFSRGSEVLPEAPKSQQLVQAAECSAKFDESLLFTDNSLFQVSDISVANSTALTESRLDQSFNKTRNAGLTFEMFDEFIKDEDVRLAHLKTVLKLREQTLLDRTKSELILLEIQKTHLLKTGKLHEASLLKKKQRGIIIKLQEERNEMLKMKQMQKNASKERKTLLKAQCSAIKAQLTSGHRVPKFNRSAVSTQRKSAGPVKAYSYQSETSASRKSSLESVLLTSHSEQSIASKASEDEIESFSQKIIVAKSTSQTDMAKRVLQRREAALQRRKTDAQDLLRWHRKLVAEERKIARLEMAATNVINQVPPRIGGEKFDFDFLSGNDVRWEESVNDAKEPSSYSMDFDDNDTAKEVSLENARNHSESSLHEIMHNINNITDELTELYKLSSVPKSKSEETADKDAASESPHETLVDHKEHDTISTNQETEQDVSSLKDVIEEPETFEKEESDEIQSEIIGGIELEPSTIVSITNQETEKDVSSLKDVIDEAETFDKEEMDEIQSEINAEIELEPSTIVSIQFEEQNSLEDGIEERIIEVPKLDLGDESEISFADDSRIEENQEESPSISSKFFQNANLNETYAIPETDINRQFQEENSNSEIENITNKCLEDENLSSEIEIDKEDSIVKQIDVKKRVSEILADAHLNTSIEEKSPRLPDIYVTTYDIISPDNSPELGSPVDNSKSVPKANDIYGIDSEAQELLKKQLAIEQEIKQIEQQQKEHRPYIFREIPNKPPPPYTPPTLPSQSLSIIPASLQQIQEVVPQIASLCYHAYVESNLDELTFPIDSLLGADKLCVEFLFDICKELAVKHYKHFAKGETVAWMELRRTSFLRPFKQRELEEMLERKVSQLFGFEKSTVKESMLMKWSRKKRDHVDELLVGELQAEEREWTNFDVDEVIVKDNVTNSLLNLLLAETATIFQDIHNKRITQNSF